MHKNRGVWRGSKSRSARIFGVESVATTGQKPRVVFYYSIIIAFAYQANIWSMKTPDTGFEPSGAPAAAAAPAPHPCSAPLLRTPIASPYSVSLQRL